MSPWDVMQELYDSGISAGLQSMWDSGLTAWVGDERSGVKAEKIFRRSEFDDIATWLDQEGRRHFPRSRYARESHGAAIDDVPQPVLVSALREIQQGSRKAPRRVERSKAVRAEKDQGSKLS